MKEITVNLKYYYRIKYTKAKQIQIIQLTRDIKHLGLYFLFFTDFFIGSLDSSYKRMHLMHANEEKLEKDSFQHLIQVLQHLSQIPIFYSYTILHTFQLLWPLMFHAQHNQTFLSFSFHKCNSV